jgi:hypothetical protein
VNLKERALLSLKATFYTELERKARSCMTPFIDEAKHLLRIARRDYQTFTILRIDFRRTQDLGELANLLADIGITLPFIPREFHRLNP